MQMLHRLGGVGSRRREVHPPTPPVLSRPWTVDAFLQLRLAPSPAAVNQARAPRRRSQVISISGPPMRSTAARVTHLRFRTARRGSVRRFICRLRSGRGEAMLEL